MESNSICVFVVTHKTFNDSLIPDGYQVIKVGTGLSSDEAKKNGYLTDDVGDNISNLNPMYCELTAQYWIWKNIINPDIVGLVHYRTFLVDYSVPGKRGCPSILTKERINFLLSKYDAILPYKALRPGGCGLLKKNVPDNEQCHDYIVLREIIYNDYPEMKDSFDKIIYGKFLSFKNMIITRRKIYNEYSKWMFDVLFKYDELMKRDGVNRVPRADGFVSESMMSIWIDWKFKESRVYRTDMKTFDVTHPEYDMKPTTMGYLKSFRTLYLAGISVLRFLNIENWVLLKRSRQTK